MPNKKFLKEGKRKKKIFQKWIKKVNQVEQLTTSLRIASSSSGDFASNFSS